MGTEKGHIANHYPQSHPGSVNVTLLGVERETRCKEAQANSELELLSCFLRRHLPRNPR